MKGRGLFPGLFVFMCRTSTVRTIYQSVTNILQRLFSCFLHVNKICLVIIIVKSFAICIFVQRFLKFSCSVTIKAHLNNELESGEYVRITSIQLFNIYRGGDFDGSKWAGLDNETDFSKITLEGDSGNLTLASTTLFAPTLMMPQPTSKSDREEAPKIIVEYETRVLGATETKTAELDLYNGPASLAAWEMGKDIVYNISISTKDEYIEFDASYTDWTDNVMTPDINVGL